MWNEEDKPKKEEITLTNNTHLHTYIHTYYIKTDFIWMLKSSHENSIEISY